MESKTPYSEWVLYAKRVHEVTDLPYSSESRTSEILAVAGDKAKDLMRYMAKKTGDGLHYTKGVVTQKYNQWRQSSRMMTNAVTIKSKELVSLSKNLRSQADKLKRDIQSKNDNSITIRGSALHASLSEMDHHVSDAFHGNDLQYVHQYGAAFGHSGLTIARVYLNATKRIDGSSNESLNASFYSPMTREMDSAPVAVFDRLQKTSFAGGFELENGGHVVDIRELRGNTKGYLNTFLEANRFRYHKTASPGHVVKETHAVDKRTVLDGLDIAIKLLDNIKPMNDYLSTSMESIHQAETAAFSKLIGLDNVDESLVVGVGKLGESIRSVYTNVHVPFYRHQQQRALQYIAVAEDWLHHAEYHNKSE